MHWRGSIPLIETLEGFAELLSAEKIRYWGVSNFDKADMEDLIAFPMGANVTTDQVLYNLQHRGIEWDLLPWCRKRHIPIMAYSPVEQGLMLEDPVLRAIASRHRATSAQIALAWILRQGDLIAIPKASRPEHVRENRQALEIQLTDRDLGELERAFPPPKGPTPLELI